MEQATPPVKVSAPDGIRIDWANHHPYVEVWDGGHLVIAGWVYGDPNMTVPAAKEPTVQKHWECLDHLPAPSLSLVPEPCFDACEGMDYEDKDINTARPPVDQPPTPALTDLLNLFGARDT